MSGDRHNEFRSALEAAVASFGIDPLTEYQNTQLANHYAMLCHWNQRVNLTRIIDPREAATLHYAESLFGARFIAEQTILDIGSGAGFPAIPLAVVRPDARVTALEGNKKKSLFLKEAKDELRLGNLEIVTARLQEFDWAGYELLTSRALDHAAAIFPLVLERLRPNQPLMLYCAPDLLATLLRQSSRTFDVDTHAIPFSESRIIAIFSR